MTPMPRISNFFADDHHRLGFSVDVLLYLVHQTLTWDDLFETKFAVEPNILTWAYLDPSFFHLFFSVSFNVAATRPGSIGVNPSNSQFFFCFSCGTSSGSGKLT